MTSLKLVLSTLSNNFQEQIFLRFPLIGKSPEEIETFLREPDHASQILLFLNKFAVVVHHSNEQKPRKLHQP